VKRALDAAVVPAVLTVGFAVALGAGLLPVGRAVGIWLLSLAALFLVRFVREVRTADAEALSRRFDAALRGRGAKVSVPGELSRMERAIELGIASADAAHRQLLPLLRAAADARLASVHGIDLMRSPDAARARLGDEAWDLLRPDRPAPNDRYATGVPRETVRHLITQVESL